MARFSFNGNEPMTDELFAKAMNCDYGIFECSCGHGYADSRGHVLGHYANFPSWEDVHEITQEQIDIAKLNAKRRHDEILASIQQGELAFVAMGGGFTSKYEDGVGNHRMRCDFRNGNGEQFFIELMTFGSGEDGFWVDFSIDRQLQKDYAKQEEERWQRIKENPHKGFHEPHIPQFYYNAKGVQNKAISKPFTWSNVVEFINKTYGCNYTSGRLLHYFIDPDEYVCEC